MEIRADVDAKVNQLFLVVEFCPHRIEINSFCINGPSVTLGAVCHEVPHQHRSAVEKGVPILRGHNVKSPR